MLSALSAHWSGPEPLDRTLIIQYLFVCIILNAEVVVCRPSGTPATWSFMEDNLTSMDKARLR